MPRIVEGSANNFYNVLSQTLGAREEAAPTSPPTALRYMYFISLGSNLGPIFQVWMKVVEIEMQERIRYLNQPKMVKIRTEVHDVP